MKNDTANGRPELGLCGLLCVLLAVIAVEPAFAQSIQSKAAKLKADYQTLRTTAGPVMDLIRDINWSVAAVKEAISVPDYLAKGSGAVVKVLAPVEDGLDAAEAVPDTRDWAESFKESLAPLRNQCQKINARTKPIADKLYPVWDRVDLFSVAVGSVDDYLTAYLDGLDGYVSTLDEIVKVLPPEQAQGTGPFSQWSTYHREERSRISANIDRTDRHILAVTAGLKALYSTLEKFKSDAEAVDRVYEPISATADKIDKIGNGLDGMRNGLADLDAALNKSVGVSFPYVKFEHLLPHKAYYRVSVSVKTIINGTNQVENEIRQKLSDALYDALKLFGLNKVVQELVNKGNNLLNSAVSELDQRLDLSIPGLAGLDSRLGILEQNILALSNYTADVSPFRNAGQDIGGATAELATLRLDIVTNSKPGTNPLAQ